MKRIVIAVLSILVFGFILVVLITGLSSYRFNKNNNLIKEHIISKNKDITNVSVEQYYGDNLYYIISYKTKNKDYIKVLNDKEEEILTQKKDALFSLKKSYKIGYKYDKLIYEVKISKKDGFIYSYYDALTGEFIKSIKLNK